MSDQIQSNPDISRLDEILPQLSVIQLRYIVARRDSPTIDAAAKAIGVKPDTVYHWPDYVEEAVKLMAQDGVHVAREMLRRAVPKAATVKIEGLDSGDERIRQSISTEILDRELGTAPQNINGVFKFDGIERILDKAWGNGDTTGR